MRDYLWNLLCPGILLVELVWIIVVEIRRYRKRKAEVDGYINAINIQPTKLRFAFSSFSWGMIISIPWLLMFWIYLNVNDLWIGLLGLMPLLLISSMPSAYPYYTILIYENKLNGPTLWGWMWKRLDLDLVWLDKEKTLKRNPGWRLGIVIFYTRGGEKMLTLGLDDAQINQILAFTPESSAVK